MELRHHNSGVNRVKGRSFGSLHHSELFLEAISLVVLCSIKIRVGGLKTLGVTYDRHETSSPKYLV